MYRAQHLRLQHVGGSDDDALVPEIVMEVTPHPGCVHAQRGAVRHEHLHVVQLFSPEDDPGCADTVDTDGHQQP